MTDIYYLGNNAGEDGVTYFNLVRDRSMVESKNYEHTDRKGHVKGYLINYEVTAASEQLLNFTVAQNTWKLRNSFRKFHAYRDIMFENAGITNQEKGRYGHTLRPFFDDLHRTEEDETDGNVGVPTAYDFAADPPIFELTGGEWTYSLLATVPLYEFGGPQMKDSILKVADEWPVMICGANVAGTGESKTSGQYACVGMIHSYNLDRMEVVTPSTDSTISGPANPLAALMASGNQAAGEILDIAEDQELELPPYDLTDAGDSIVSSVVKTVKTPSTLGVVRGSCFVPAGLLAIAQSLDSAYVLKVEIVGEVLCKDFA